MKPRAVGPSMMTLRRNPPVSPWVQIGWRLGAGAEANVAWQRALDEEVSGPFVTAGGLVIPGTEVTHETGMDTLTVSFSFRGAR